MNFVLHHYLAWRDLGTPGAAIGSMLPDFWRMVDRRMRPARRVDAADRSPVAADVLRGIEHHLWCDDWFHKHDVFVDGERHTAAALCQASFEAPKMVLMAHVCWELCLDGALLRRSGVDREVENVQRNLETVGQDPLREAAAAHGAVAARDDFDQRLDDLLERAAYGSWIPGYASGRGIAERLAGVRRRVGLPSMAESDMRRLSRVCESLLEVAEQPLEKLLLPP